MIKNILEFWNAGAYTQAASIAIAIITLLIFISKWKKDNPLNILTYFIGLYVLCGIGALFDVGTGHKYDPFTMKFLIYMDLAETIVEQIVFSIYISSSITNSKFKAIIKPLPLLFITYLFFSFLYKINNGLNHSSFLQHSFTVQALFLFIPCILYFTHIFKLEPSFNLLELQSFWVVTGISFVIVCTFPLSVFGQSLITSNYKLYIQLFCIFNVFYCLLFMMIIKAQLCKPLQIK